MKRITKLIFCLQVLVCLSISVSTNGQFRWGPPTPNDTLHSAIVHPDGSVTFGIYAPDAKKVSISGDVGAENFREMLKDGNGIWRTTTSSLKPGVYRYSFVVDGVKVNDPKSIAVSESPAIVEIPGKESDPWTVKDVPHGSLRLVWYKSGTTNTIRRMHIYTPPGYDISSFKLPVLYLIHGGGDNDNAWPTIGRANFIIDNLIADKKISPMIVVMPDGSVPGEIFTNDLVKDVIPYVEKNFRVRNDKESRALAGLSMGGLETLDTGIPYNKLFGYLGVFSSGWFADQPAVMAKAESDIKDNAEQFRKNVTLFWISMGGKEDIAWKNCQNMLKLFDKYGIKYQYSEIPGGHTWMVWRDNLSVFSQLLFKSGTNQ